MLPVLALLRGQLDYSRNLRPWKLRNIPIDGPTDAYGDSVVLSVVPDMKSFRPGDMVVVRGSLFADSKASSGLSPRYKLEEIEPLPRSPFRRDCQPDGGNSLGFPAIAA